MKKNNKQTISLTESDLHKIVSNSVKKVLNEQVNPIMIQMLMMSINSLQKYVSAGQYQQALKTSQVITAKLNAIIQQTPQQQMQQPQAVQQMQNGNGQYVKGQGWQ